MYITDKTIEKLSRDGGLVSPFDPQLLNPCSYDLTLGEALLAQDESQRWHPFSPKNADKIAYTRRSRAKVMLPGEFLLATTKETITLPDNMAAQIVGKSSIGRMGLFIQNAGHIDPGFSGQVTLELFNASELILDLSEFDRICQIVFIPTMGPVEQSYAGKYQNQVGVTAARVDNE